MHDAVMARDNKVVWTLVLQVGKYEIEETAGSFETYILHGVTTQEIVI
jgi:hypothetical protein